jgi:hypothetical protein
MVVVVVLAMDGNSLKLAEKRSQFSAEALKGRGFEPRLHRFQTLTARLGSRTLANL